MLRLALETCPASRFVDSFLLEVLLERSAVVVDRLHRSDTRHRGGIVLVGAIRLARDLRLRITPGSLTRRNRTNPPVPEELIHQPAVDLHPRPTSRSIALLNDPVHRVPDERRMRVGRVGLCSPLLEDRSEADVFAIQDVRDLDPVELLRGREPTLGVVSASEGLRERGGVVVEEVNRDLELAEALGERKELIADVEVQAAEEVVGLRSVTFGAENVANAAKKSASSQARECWKRSSTHFQE